MCYVKTSLSLRQLAWIGDDPYKNPGVIEPHMYADADLGGCFISNRSTSGRHFSLEGPNSLFPISAFSKRQGNVSTSTPEAEMVAAFTAVKDAMLPLGYLLGTILPGRKRLGIFHEDNAAMRCICRSGRNPTMRHIGRTHRIAVSWLHEVLGKELDRIGPDDIETWYTNSDRMRADIYTKAFTDSTKWEHATKMIGMAAMKQIDTIVKFMSENFKSEPDQPK